MVQKFVMHSSNMPVWISLLNLFIFVIPITTKRNGNDTITYFSKFSVLTVVKSFSNRKFHLNSDTPYLLERHDYYKVLSIRLCACDTNFCMEFVYRNATGTSERYIDTSWGS